jgi:hypothetical protein
MSGTTRVVDSMMLILLWYYVNHLSSKLYNLLFHAAFTATT